MSKKKKDDEEMQAMQTKPGVSKEKVNELYAQLVKKHGKALERLSKN